VGKYKKKNLPAHGSECRNVMKTKKRFSTTENTENTERREEFMKINFQLALSKIPVRLHRITFKNRNPGSDNVLIIMKS